MLLLEPCNEPIVMIGDHHRDQDQIRIYADVWSHPVGASRRVRTCCPWFYRDDRILSKRHTGAEIHEAGAHHQDESECINISTYHSHLAPLLKRRMQAAKYGGHDLGFSPLTPYSEPRRRLWRSMFASGSCF